MAFTRVLSGRSSRQAHCAMPIEEAPVWRSAAEQIKVLRQQASAKFLSASNPGVYQL